MSLPLLLLWLAAQAPPPTASFAPTASPAAMVDRAESIMATTIDVRLPAAHADEAALVFGAFRHVETLMNEWKDGTPLAAVNRAAGQEAVAVPEELFALIARSVELAGTTEGAFDLTWAALWGLWDFNAATPVVPDAARAAAAARLIDARRVVLDPARHTVFLPQTGMKIGLGGIAKGYALDRAAEALRARGVSQFLLSAGGQVYAGKNAEGRAWRIGVRDPRGGAADYFGVIEVEDASISTSGDYERFFIVDGVRYHHILDPRTGFPSRGLRSATVVSADATLADALSTALMVLGRERGLALIEKLPQASALVVDDDGKVWVSARLKARWMQLRPPHR